MRQDMDKKALIEYCKNNLAYEGYTHANEVLVRFVEIINEQDQKIYMLQSSLGMIPKGELHE